MSRSPSAGQVAGLVEGLSQVEVGPRVVRLELERAAEVKSRVRDESLAPQQVGELEVRRRVRWMEPKGSAEIRLGVRVAAKPPVDSTPEHQELGLVGGQAKPVGEHLDGLGSLVESLEQAGQVEASLDLLGLGREERAVDRYGRGGKRSLRDRVSPLEQLLHGRPCPSARRLSGRGRAASGRRRIGG